MEMNAQTTLQQIGTRTLMAIGAGEYVGGGDSLHFKVFGRSRKIRITLASDDTYTVELWNIRSMQVLKSFEGVYAENLSTVCDSLVNGGRS